jgi:hypothetical protein
MRHKLGLALYGRRQAEAPVNLPEPDRSPLALSVFEQDDSDRLRPQEEALLRCAAAGKWWKPDLEHETEFELDPAHSYGWDTSRRIRARVIRCLVARDIWPGEHGPWPVSPKGVMLQGALIEGELDLEGVHLATTAWLHHSAFANKIVLMDAETKTFSLRGSRMNEGISADRVRVDGALLLEDIYCNGGLLLSGAIIHSQLGITGGHLEHTGTALTIDSAHVGAAAKLDRLRVIGLFDATAAVIEGDLDCNGSRFFCNKSEHAICALGAEVSGSIHLSGGFQAVGPIVLLGATLGHNLNCRKAEFDGMGKSALIADRIKVGASVFLGNPFRSKGDVNFAGARIGGQLVCSGNFFSSPKGYAFMADGISVRADMFLRDMKTEGEVNLFRAQIGGSLRCEGASFRSPRTALDLTLAKIGGGLFLQKLAPITKEPDWKWPSFREHSPTGMRGRLVLEQAACRTYCDDFSAWPQRGQLVLDGFLYERFQDCPTDWRARTKWLRCQERDHLRSSFRPQPWTQAIGVLRTMGFDSDARELGVRRENARLLSGQLGLAGRIWALLLWSAVAYGYKPWRALGWSAILLTVSWFVFASAGQLGYMAPRDGNVRVSPAWEHPERNLSKKPEIPSTYPPFNGLVYALDTFIPVISLGQSDAWEPSTRKTIVTVHAGPDRAVLASVPERYAVSETFLKAGGHRVFVWVNEVAGWILVSLFIAGMSGVMRKE